MPFTPSLPESEEISLVLSDSGLQITEFEEYSFNSNLLTPTDGWSFTIGAERIRPEIKSALVPGAAVKLHLNGLVQSSGYIDSIEKSANREGGTEWRIEGRDRLGQAVDACADPTRAFKDSMTLLDAMKSLFGPFGWSEDDQFDTSNEGNRQLKGGAPKRRIKTQKSDAKGFGRRALKSYTLHQYRPYSREGVFEFASRISQRFGLWIWATADGEQLVIGAPDFDAEPSQKLIRNSHGDTNVLEGTVKFDLAEQPTHILADSFAQAGEFSKGRFKAVMANPALIFEDESYVPPEIQKYINAGARVLGGFHFPEASSMRAPRPRILYLHDDQSQTPEQLENFVRREMSLLLRRSLTANYTVEGHGQMSGGAFVPWIVDTTVDVEDEVADLRERLYLLGRTFNKSRNSGTTTQLELIRLNTLIFSSTDK